MFWIRIDPDWLNPDPDPGVWWPKTEGKKTQLTGRPSYWRSLQPSKENIQNCKKWNYQLFSMLMGHFCPPGSGSGLCIRILIRIQGPHWIRIHNTDCRCLFKNEPETLVKLKLFHWLNKPSNRSVHSREDNKYGLRMVPVRQQMMWNIVTDRTMGIIIVKMSIISTNQNSGNNWPVNGR